MADQLVSFRDERALRSGSVISLLFVSVILSGCVSKAQQPGNGQAPPPPLVEVVTTEISNAAVYTEYPAQTYARNLVEVRGRVTGYVERWLFRPGQRVRSGQPLYTLDVRPYRAQVQQAQGTVRQASAELEFAKGQVSLLQAEANLAAAKANLVRAEQDYLRLKPLVEQDAASRQDLDAATAGFRAAEAEVRAQEATVQQARLNTQTQIQAAEGKLQTQRGTLTTANLNVEYGTIRAPIAGMIGDTQIPVGGLVNPNGENPLTTIVPLDPIWVRFKLSESQYLDYQRMQKTPGRRPALELFLADNTKLPHAGSIENALNQVDPRTGTLEIQARFPNPEGVVLPGQFGRVRFQTRNREGVIVIPQRAVQQNQSIQSVFVVGAGNKLEARPVRTAERIGEDWIIESGLRPGERVVVEGTVLARPGMPVTPKPFRAKEGTPAADASQSGIPPRRGAPNAGKAAGDGE